ncbi:MAG: dihydrodipicolinate synthase family protein [Verrucomicrobiota bacterium]
MDTGFVRGVVPPIVTPVDAEERVVEASLRQIVDHVIVGGVHGILSLGSNGEFFGLDPEQQQRALSVTVDQAAGRVPVYMGIGAVATRECIRLARQGEKAKARAVTILPPMFLSPSEGELYQHFRAVADATSLPVLLYNNPDRMRTGISAALLERLAEVPNIVGIKDSSGDLTLTAEYIRRTRDKGFKVMAGRDIMILGALAYGGVGCVAATANVVPRLVVEIFERFQAGDLAGAREAQFRLAPLRMAFNLGSFPVVTKDYMRLLGFDVGEPIRPNLRCSEANMARLRQILEDLGAARLA